MFLVTLWWCFRIALSVHRLGVSVARLVVGERRSCWSGALMPWVWSALLCACARFHLREVLSAAC